MGGTALKRKARRNKAKSKSRKQLIKLQGFKPIIRSIDLEAIKAGFKNASKKDEKLAEAPKEEIEKEVKTPAGEVKKPVKDKVEKVDSKIEEPVVKKKPAKKAEPKAKEKAKEPKAETKSVKAEKEN